MLEQINSDYLLINLFEYIEDENYKMKLFVHSKLFQKRLKINLYDYKLEFFDSKSKNFYIMDYFFIMIKKVMKIMTILIKIY